MHKGKQQQMSDIQWGQAFLFNKKQDTSTSMLPQRQLPNRSHQRETVYWLFPPGPSGIQHVQHNTASPPLTVHGTQQQLQSKRQHTRVHHAVKRAGNHTRQQIARAPRASNNGDKHSYSTNHTYTGPYSDHPVNTSPQGRL